MTATRIEVKDLVIRYGDTLAVNGVSFTVGRGQHVTLLGPSACGKLTGMNAAINIREAQPSDSDFVMSLVRRLGECELPPWRTPDEVEAHQAVQLKIAFTCAIVGARDLAIEREK